ncbi:aspartyl-phosphate phosphatase Spo0E family protein [Paenibacillus sp. KS1]|uniref:aspartyl-phosphate phosphatase Spo0E family protein n=1 Tax=Paenibacillus sp. KS1 TaxID=1849249 RepID=UPI0009F54EBC
MDKNLEEKINELKEKLAEAVGNKERLTDEEVVQISQQLDTYIVKTHSRQDGERRKR